ncbi:MAG: glycosyltransferase family 4 protein, partial [Candidatus Nanopelagicales bacterium]
YGGTELVVDQLARGLEHAGCEVVLFATGDSAASVETRWLYPEALGTAVPIGLEQAHVEAAYKALADVDVIHDHTLSGPQWAVANGCQVPVVTTVHGRFTAGLRHAYRAMATGGVGVVAISHAQRRTAPEIPIDTVIHHGIDTTGWPVGRGRGGYVLFLGRMHPDKGAHRAIQIARAAGRRILLAAKMWDPAEHRYFAEQVEPLLGPDAVYVGEVGGACKRDLLGGAEALINPIRWPEPFGLVMIEALAHGTPVLSFAEGAAPEIVEHGRSGFLCADEGDMVEALRHVADLDRADCRARVDVSFSAEHMVRAHLDLYRRRLSMDGAGTRAARAPAFATNG